MHQAIPDRSMSWPMSSSSGTRIASCSRDSAAYLLVMDVPADMHLDGVVDVVLAVSRRALLFCLLALGDNAFDRTVDLRAQREADVVREEDRDLTKFLARQLLVVQDRVRLDLDQLFHALGGKHAEQHHPAVAHRQPRA